MTARASDRSGSEILPVAHECPPHKAPRLPRIQKIYSLRHCSPMPYSSDNRSERYNRHGSDKVRNRCFKAITVLPPACARLCKIKMYWLRTWRMHRFRVIDGKGCRSRRMSLRAAPPPTDRKRLLRTALRLPNTLPPSSRDRSNKPAIRWSALSKATAFSFSMAPKVRCTRETASFS